MTLSSDRALSPTCYDPGMATRPRTIPPKFRFTFWKREGSTFYFCEPVDLLRAIEESGVPERLIKSRMLAGHHYLAEALAGKRLDRWGVAHIETGLSPVTEQEAAYL